MVEWQEIRKKVWAILKEKNDPVPADGLIAWIKSNYGESLTKAYLDDDYMILRMIVGKTFAGADGKGLMIDYTKVNPDTKEQGKHGEGWLFLGPPKVVVGTMTLSKVSGTPITANASTQTAPAEQKPDPKAKSAEKAEPKPPKVKVAEPTEPHMGCDITPITEQMIPQNDGYIPRKLGKYTDIDILKTAFLNQKNVMLSGPPGGGKTAAARHFCYQYKLPYVRVECHGGIEIADLVGQWVPNPECAGKFVWNDGLLTHLVRHGGVFVADEVNGMPREFALKFHGLLDDERRLILTEKDGEVIKAHKRFMLIGCQNPNAEGTRKLNNAFFDRFHIAMEYNYDTDIEEKLIDDKYIREFADKARGMHGKELTTHVSTRMMLHYEQNCDLFDEDTASQFFIHKFDPEERQKVKEVFDLVVKGRKRKSRNSKSEEEAAAGLGALFG